MKADEANKIIAEYMGGCSSYNDNGHCPICKRSSHCCNPIVYSESLDALVSVWEKLNKEKPCEATFFRITSPLADGWLMETIWGHHDGDIPIKREVTANIQEAACIATAKAIKELSNEQT